MMTNLCFAQDYLARARTGKEWGYIDAKGNYVVSPQFPNAYNFVKLAW